MSRRGSGKPPASDEDGARTPLQAVVLADSFTQVLEVDRVRRATPGLTRRLGLYDVSSASGRSAWRGRKFSCRW